LGSNELFRSGVRVPIQDLPLRVLRLLLEAEGRAVTREQLQSALWPDDTFVDFEHGVNTAVKKLRQALDDSAERPKYVETLPRLGYRLMTTVQWMDDLEEKCPPPRLVAIDRVGPFPVALVPSRETPRRRALLAGVGILVMLATGGYLLWPRPPKQPVNLSVTPFTTFPGFEIAPSFSPDGDKVVFSWFGQGKDFQFDLYAKQVGQEQVLQLTHHPASFLASAWSPNGRFIVFKREAEPEASGVYLISVLGGSERKLASIAPFGGPEAIAVGWSSDSKWVAFAEASTPNEMAPSPAHYRIHMVNVESYEERTLPPPARECVDTLHPAFSSDGKYLASMCVLTQGVFRIYVQNPDGTQPRAVTDVKSSEGFADLDWAADNQSLIYAADLHLWRVPITGGRSEMLLFAQDAESVSVAPVGNRLVYAQVRHPGSIWRIDITSPTKPKGPATKIISSSRGDLAQRVSPDGKYLAFLSWRSGNPEVWISNREGSDPVQLSSFGGPQIGTPSWSPDSRRIVFDVRAADKPELYVVNIDGGVPKRLVTGAPNAANPFWSWDGRWIYFNTERPDAIWKTPAEGGAALAVTGEGRFVPQESMDGSRVFFYRAVGEQHQVWSASVDGGDERAVTGMPADVGWALARSGIYFIDGPPRHASVNYYDCVTRRVEKIADLPEIPIVGSPTISSDGHTFLFAGIERPESDIFLVQGFR
jgi:Tol biopolymer transport system component/DNA-binding winged helix-turn-helix (wHTH) protein